MTSYIANELNQYTVISNRPLAIENLPFYDADGNMTSYNGWTFSWDAENRLIKAEPVEPQPGARSVQNDYDYLSRRVQKEVYYRTNDQWYSEATYQYLYDGWQLVSEKGTVLVSPQTPKGSRKKRHNDYYLWGLDMSQGHRGHRAIGVRHRQ